jgi:hypothetical protein
MKKASAGQVFLSSRPNPETRPYRIVRGRSGESLTTKIRRLSHPSGPVSRDTSEGQFWDCLR